MEKADAAVDCRGNDPLYGFGADGLLRQVERKDQRMLQISPAKKCQEVI